MIWNTQVGIKTLTIKKKLQTKYEQHWIINI
jgi:hypothetical protein